MTVRIDSSDNKNHLDFRGATGLPITETVIYSLTTQETKHLALMEDYYTKTETESLINNIDIPTIPDDLVNNDSLATTLNEYMQGIQASLDAYRTKDDLKYSNKKHLRISDDKLYVLDAYEEGYTYNIKTTNGIEFEYIV